METDMENIIKSRRKELGFSAEDIAKVLGVSRATIYRYEKGEIEKVPGKVLEPLAKALHTTPAYLMGWKNDPGNQSTYDFCNETRAKKKSSKSYRVIPIHFLGTVAAGYNHIANDAAEFLYVPEAWLGRRQPDDFFALRVKGSSMYPKYCDGDEILCLRDESLPENGQVCVVLYNGEEATLKKVEFPADRSWLELIPINPEYEPKRISGADMEQCKILGKVIRLIRTEDKNIDEE